MGKPGTTRNAPQPDAQYRITYRLNQREITEDIKRANSILMCDGRFELHVLRRPLEDFDAFTQRAQASLQKHVYVQTECPPRELETYPMRRGNPNPRVDNNRAAGTLH